MPNNNYVLTSDGELYHYGVPGMKWGHRKARANTPSGGYKKRIKDAVSNKVNEKAKQNRERIEETMAYRTGGPDAVKRLKKERERKERRKTSAAIATAKGKDKAKLILKEIGKDILKGPRDAHGNRHPTNERTGNI